MPIRSTLRIKITGSTYARIELDMTLTPDHWSGETRRFANNLMTSTSNMKSHELGKLELDGLLAISVELAELRAVLGRESELTAVLSGEFDYERIGRVIAGEMATEAGMPPELLPEKHETSGFAMHCAMPENERTAYDRAAIITGHASIKLVGWYCAGGHDVELGDNKAEPNFRFDDPCSHAVPTYVLVK